MNSANLPISRILVLDQFEFNYTYFDMNQD